MKNPYLLTVFNLIVINAVLIYALGILGGLQPSSAIQYIIHYSKWIVMLFIPYLFLSIKQIQSNKVLIGFIIFLPAIIMTFFVLKDYYLLYTGQILQGGFSNGRFNLSHLKLILTGTIIIANYLYYKKRFIADSNSVS